MMFRWRIGHDIYKKIWDICMTAKGNSSWTNSKKIAASKSVPPSPFRKNANFVGGQKQNDLMRWLWLPVFQKKTANRAKGSLLTRGLRQNGKSPGISGRVSVRKRSIGEWWIENCLCSSCKLYARPTCSVLQFGLKSCPACENRGALYLVKTFFYFLFYFYCEAHHQNPTSPLCIGRWQSCHLVATLIRFHSAQPGKISVHFELSFVPFCNLIFLTWVFTIVICKKKKKKKRHTGPGIILHCNFKFLAQAAVRGGIEIVCGVNSPMVWRSQECVVIINIGQTKTKGAGRICTGM